MPGTLTRRILFIVACFALIAFPLIYRSSVDADSSAPGLTQQDRKITPAGKLILDASNGLPAVAPLTIEFHSNSRYAGAGR